MLQVNLKAIRRLRTYCHSVRQTTDAEERILDEVQDLILQGLSKQIKILTLSAQITRAFRGGHWISCKSAKDRTSMLCTLEASQAILPDWHIGWNTMLIDESHMEFANMLRGQEGVRLSNCESNTGKRAYAFNALQLKTLPKEMRPPKATCGTNES